MKIEVFKEEPKHWYSQDLDINTGVLTSLGEIWIPVGSTLIGAERTNWLKISSNLINFSLVDVRGYVPGKRCRISRLEVELL